MDRNRARESRRETIEDILTNLRVIGAAGLNGSDAIEAFAILHQCAGRLQGIDELEAYEEACQCGQRVRFPRPAVELIDPLLTPAQVEAAWHEARQTELEEAAEAFEVADEEESVGELHEALDRAAEGGGTR